MNKQEVIDELTKTRKAFFEVGFNLDLNQPNRDVAIGVYTGIGIAKNFVERLDEPNHDKCYEKMADYEKQIGDLERKIEEMGDRESGKVKVPAYVAEWYAENEYQLDTAILDYMVESYETDQSEFGKWFDNEENHPIETLVRMKDGYEIEKEAKYRVNIGGLYLKEPLGDTSDSTISMTWNKEYAYPFDSWNTAREHISKLGGTVEKAEILVDGSVEEV